MWIDVVLSGLLHIGRVYSQSNKCYRRYKRTSAVGARRLFPLGRVHRWIETVHLLHLGQFFWWIEDERQLIRKDPWCKYWMWLKTDVGWPRVILVSEWLDGGAEPI